MSAEHGRISEIDEKVELKRLRRLEQRVQEFDRRSGLDIEHTWDIGPIGDAVALLQRGGLAAVRKTLEDIRDRHYEAVATIDAALAQSE